MPATKGRILPLPLHCQPVEFGWFVGLLSVGVLSPLLVQFIQAKFVGEFKGNKG